MNIWCLALPQLKSHSRTSKENCALKFSEIFGIPIYSPSINWLNFVIVLTLRMWFTWHFFAYKMLIWNWFFSFHFSFFVGINIPFCLFYTTTCFDIKSVCDKYFVNIKNKSEHTLNIWSLYCESKIPWQFVFLFVSWAACTIEPAFLILNRFCVWYRFRIRFLMIWMSCNRFAGENKVEFDKIFWLIWPASNQNKIILTQNQIRNWYYYW